MNKEAEMHLSELPRLNKPRSTFPYNQSIWGTMSVGKLYPLEWIECNPGDTLTLDISHITRAMTQVVPVMDSSYLDIQAFFVPLRQIWDNWVSMWGENKTGHWAQPTSYETPQIKLPNGGFKTNSLADVLGIPVNVGTEADTVNALPIRGYLKIWNEWYRDENLQDPCYYHTDETIVTGENYNENWDYVTDSEKGGALLNVCRFHDYFSSMLPDLQRGPSVSIPLGDTAPVVGNGTAIGITDGTSNAGLQSYTASGFSPMLSNKTQYGEDTGHTAVGNQQPLSNGLAIGLTTDPEKSGLSVDLSSALGATITQIRQSIAIQHFYEKLAAGGGRYIEYLSTIWGTDARDDVQQRSTYLGGRRFPININQVLQTSSTDNVSPQGNTAAFSCTVDEDDLFTCSTTEHGYIYIMACLRTNHSYSQGLARKWSRKGWTDYYVPTFDGITAQDVKNKEIYFQGAVAGQGQDDEVMGYQEAYADYRMQIDRVFGQMRATSQDSQGNPNSLAIWTYQDYYEQLPKLDSQWIQEDGSNLQRTISLQGTEYDQFQCQFYLKGKFSRVMPTYGVPGVSYI